MPMNFFSVTVATPGTPQQLVPDLGQIIMGGVTYPAGSATLRGFQIQVQAAPGNTAGKSIFVGRKSMVVSTKVGCGFSCLAGTQPISLGQFGGMEDVADLWIDTDSVAAATEKLLVTVVS